MKYFPVTEVSKLGSSVSLLVQSGSPLSLLLPLFLCKNYVTITFDPVSFSTLRFVTITMSTFQNYFARRSLTRASSLAFTTPFSLCPLYQRDLNGTIVLNILPGNTQILFYIHPVSKWFLLLNENINFEISEGFTIMCILQLLLSLLGTFSRRNYKGGIRSKSYWENYAN